MHCDNTYVKINLDAIRSNMEAIGEKAGVPVMAVVKADAYGHGAIAVARLLEESCAFFGVSSAAEAFELRQAGLTKPILILGHTPTDTFPELIRQGIRPAIFLWEDAVALSEEAVRQDAVADFHFALDTGMSRIGFQPTQEDAQICAQIAALPNLRVEGLFSHFATADCGNLSRARNQACRFDKFCDMLEKLGVHIPIRHLNNSAGLMNFDRQYDMVRAGIITYGLYPSDEVDPGLLELKPALQWFSRISHIKTLPAGREISYGGTYVTPAPTRVATVTAGYADGYKRSLSGKFYVLIHGKKAPILGRVCMDQMMVDVTDIPEAQPGDTVTLIGRSEDSFLSVEEIAAKAGSFNYEFVCGISRRVPRIYYLDGKSVGTVHYLLGNLKTEE